MGRAVLSPRDAHYRVAPGAVKLDENDEWTRFDRLAHAAPAGNRRSLSGGLWEVRSNLTDGIARVIFFLYEGNVVLLNGFVKKTQKTPDAAIDLARKRKKETET